MSTKGDSKTGSKNGVFVVVAGGGKSSTKRSLYGHVFYQLRHYLAPSFIYPISTMKKVCLFAALALLFQSCDTNSLQLAQLRTENRALKVRLALLGQDTAVTVGALASVSSLATDTSTGTLSTPAPAPMWAVQHYVNDFGDETEKGYITNGEVIVGTFSNSATQDSPLLVKFLIDADKSINIKLFEYASNNPVKAYGSEGYSVKVKDKDGSMYRLQATNYESDRMTLDKASAKRLNAALLKGGKLLFVISEDDSPTEYRFTIDNADGYLDALKKLNK